MVVPGVYHLLIRLRRPAGIPVGALGRIEFAAGWYVYSGSAQNGLHQRVGRHLRCEKRKHWHIDYLLAVANGVEAFVLPGVGTTECELHKAMMRDGTAIARFGASDCKCSSHLLYFRHRPQVGLMPWNAFGADTEGLTVSFDPR